MLSKTMIKKQDHWSLNLCTTQGKNLFKKNF